MRHLSAAALALLLATSSALPAHAGTLTAGQQAYLTALNYCRLNAASYLKLRRIADRDVAMQAPDAWVAIGNAERFGDLTNKACDYARNRYGVLQASERVSLPIIGED
jgi:hypothetical protein